MTRVVLYSTPTCAHCHWARDFFQENAISYQEVDVSRDDKAREEMINRSRQMEVPVIEVNGEMIVGFDEVVVARKVGLL